MKVYGEVDMPACLLQSDRSHPGVQAKLAERAQLGRAAARHLPVMVRSEELERKTALTTATKLQAHHSLCRTLQVQVQHLLGPDQG